MASFTLHEVIDYLGFGKFGCKLVFVVAIFLVADGAEINLMALISPMIQCEWKLTNFGTSLTASSVFLGMGTGAIYFGWLGDKYGRRKIFIAASFLVCYFGMLSASSPSYPWFIILRFSAGIGIGAVSFAYTYFTEFTPTKHRGKVGQAAALWFACGSIYVALIGYLNNSIRWRVLLLLAGLPVLLFLFLSPWLPESVRYLQNEGDLRRILDILRRISVDNNLELPSNLMIECKPSDSRGDCRILFNKKHRKNMIIMIITWLGTFLFYYGSVLIGPKILHVRTFCSFNKTVELQSCHMLTEEDYRLNMISALADWPGLLINILLIDVVGRKKMIVGASAVTSTCFLLLNVCLSDKILAITIFIFRASAMSASETAYVYAAELFPNVVRTTALGVLNSTVRLSLIFMPFAFQTLTRASINSMMFVSFIITFLCALLPETKDAELSNI